MTQETESERWDALAQRKCPMCSKTAGPLGKHLSTHLLEYDCSDCHVTGLTLWELIEGEQCKHYLDEDTWFPHRPAECPGPRRVLLSGDLLLAACIRLLHRWGWQATLWVNGDVTAWNHERQISKPSMLELLEALVEVERG